MDDATLERVGDAIMEGAYPLSGAYYTAEERADEIPDGLYGAVREYVDRHPEVDGGIQVGWGAGRWTLFVGIVGTMRAHRAALTRIGGERVVVERRRRTVAELQAIADRVRVDEPELTRAGLSLIEIWWDPALGVVEVVVVGGPSERAAIQLFAARYGETVHVDWLCRARLAEAPHPFGCWASEGRRIRVFFAFDPDAQRTGTARVTQESDEQIVVALSRLEPLDPLSVLLPAGLRRHHADLELREPVDGRAVIDASAGVVRPSLVQMRSRPDRRWPHPAGLELRGPGVGESAEILIEDLLGLSVHAHSVLDDSGVETLDDLIQMRADERVALLDALSAPELRPVLTRQHAGMDTPSSWLEPEAYVPPTLPPSRGDWWWPPGSRVMAIEWARRMRLFVRGLAIDDATLERVADAVIGELADPHGGRVRPGRPPPALYYTAEEREDKFPDGLYDAVREYVDRHPELDGGIAEVVGRIDVGWRDGRWTLFVGVAGDPQAHRAALTRIGGERVVVESRPPPDTDAELRIIEDRVRADDPRLPTANLFVVRIDTNPWHGVVEVQVVGDRDELEAAAEFFAARYGDAVAVRWLGPNRFLEVLHPFASWTSDGRRIRVFFALDHNGQQPGTARVAQETDEEIVIALSRLEPVQSFRTAVGGLSDDHADVELREPVGARIVIDASTRVVRPSLTQLRSRPRSRRHPAGWQGVLLPRGPADVAEPAELLIEELELSVHACELLHAGGVQSVDELLRLSAEQTAALAKMNQKTFDEIVDALAAHRLSLTH